MSYPYLRLVLAISLDGRIAYAKGDNENIGGEGDRKVLEEALAWSDATLMGSNTLKEHKNTCLIHNAKLIQQREHEGRSKQPVSIVVSNRAKFPKKLEFFDQPVQRYLLSKNSILINGFDRHFFMRENWSETFAELNKEGLSKLTILGGIKLLNSLLLEDQIDELQLTFSPRLIGGKYTWIPSNMNTLPIQFTKLKSWRLKETENLGEDEVMLRYYRNRS